MFGFFKKKFTEEDQMNLFVNITAYQGWSLEFRKKDLTTTEIMDILERIARRMRINASKNELQALTLMVLSNPPNWQHTKGMRERMGFDANIIGFCNSLGLGEEYYRP